MSRTLHILYIQTLKHIKLEELQVNHFVTAAVTVSMRAQSHYIHTGLSPSTGNKPDTTRVVEISVYMRYIENAWGGSAVAQ